MGSRAVSEELDQENGLFIKGGIPVKFCFHSSVRQGRRRLTEDIERHGGRVVVDERETNVLLMDEEADIALMRRRYYSSPELYRMSIFVEPRGFVRHCITTGYYGHLGPPHQKMPGPVPGANAGRARVPFTSEDKQHLAHYLSTIFPTRDGRLGMKAYKDLEQLGQFHEYAWARRHTAHSWREHYKKNPEEMDRWIEFYARHLEGHGHQLGQDRRTRNLQALRQEEEEEEEEEQPQPQPQRRRQESVEQDAAPRQQAAEVNAAAREYLARHELDLVAFEGGEEAPLEEEDVAGQELQRAKRQHPYARRQRDAQALHAKRARVAEARPRQNGQPPAVEQGRGESQAPGEGARMEESPELEGSDLFGDHEYVQEQAYEYNGVPDMDLPRPHSPEAGSIPDEEGPPAPTQATLVASPDAAEKHISSQSSRAAEEPAPQPTAPPSSQVTLVMTHERAAIRRVRGASVQPAPAQPRSLVEAPYRNTRSRSRSVEPQPAAPRRREAKGKGKAKANELLPILEAEQVEAPPVQRTKNTSQASSSAPSTTNNGISSREAFEDEMAVEGLLEGTDADRLESDEDSDEDSDTFPPLPPFQDIDADAIDLDSNLDSDDAETHHVLELAAKNDAPKDDEDNASEEEDDKNRKDRIKQTANRPLRQPTPLSDPKPASRVTRSMAHQAHKTGSNSMAQVRDREPQFPSPGTKARAAVDRVNEAKRNLPYAPPAGSQAAKALGRRG